MWNTSRFCVSSLRWGHANLFCTMTMKPSKEQATPTPDQKAPETVPTRSKTPRQRRQKRSRKQEDPKNIPSLSFADSPATSAPDAPSGQPRNSAPGLPRNTQVKTTSKDSLDSSLPVRNEKASNETASSPPEIETAATSCLGVRPEKM